MVYCFDLLDKPNSMVLQISLLTEFDHYPILESWVLFSKSITILKVRGDLVYEWLIRDMLTKSPIVTGNLLSEDEEGNIPTMPDDAATIFFGWKGDRKATFWVYEAKKTKWNLESHFYFIYGTSIIPVCIRARVFHFYTSCLLLSSHECFLGREN